MQSIYPQTPMQMVEDLNKTKFKRYKNRDCRGATLRKYTKSSKDKREHCFQLIDLEDNISLKKDVWMTLGEAREKNKEIKMFTPNLKLEWRMVKHG
jgi:hypothetical protein